MKLASKRTLALAMALLMALTLLAACGGGGDTSTPPADTGSTPAGSSSAAEPAPSGDPIKFSASFKDNPTYPFSEDWYPIKTATELVNAEIDWQVYPSNDYDQKITLALNTGAAPDVMLWVQTSSSTYAQFTVNGSFISISDNMDKLPHFSSRIEEFGLTDTDMGQATMKDGKLYCMPVLSDKPIYNAGTLLRTDLLERYELDMPETYDDLYEYMKLIKQDYPDSYPATSYVDMHYMLNYTCPPFGVQLGKYSPTAHVLSYDYDKDEYFAGAISDNYREWCRYFSKLYAEGLLDPEYTNNPSDQWTNKLATGISMVTWAWYDQIGGLEANATEEGTKFDMMVPLKGSVAAHTVSMGRVSNGIAINAATESRDDFDRLLSTIDNMFYSPEIAPLFGIGEEGLTYDIVDGEIKFKEEYETDPNGTFKALQIAFGMGSYNTQMLWIKAEELLKKDAHYTEINDAVDAMNGIPALPPKAKFDADDQEEVSMLTATLADTFDVWSNNFVTGAKSVENDWDEYVAEMESKGINTLLEFYVNNIA